VYLAGVISLFVLHKLDLEWRAAGAALLPTALFVRLSYSYVFLRLCDAARAVAGGARLLDPLSLLGYLFPFHMLVAGPIGVYREHLEADARPLPEPGFAALLSGVNTVTTGLFYKLAVAEALRTFAFGLNGPLVSRGVGDSALLFVYLFFDFAGYSLAALGLGRLLGVPTPVNFDRPFLATSLTEFWQRWHASLGRWVRAHVFVPLQVRLVRAWGPARATPAAFVVLVTAFGFIGLWHGLHPALLAWGVGIGLLLALEKLARERLLRAAWTRGAVAQAAWRVVGPAYVFAAMTLSLHPVWERLL
jgi:D-alanyl-lipoteichoic acid acyltransferase DltB (MBOAT superfamily)